MGDGTGRFYRRWSAMPVNRRVIALASIGTAVGCVVAITLLTVRPPVYASQAIISISPREKSAVPSADMIRLLSTKYVAYASSDATLTRVADEVGVEPDMLRTNAEATMPAGTTTVYVQVTTTDRSTSIDAANALTLGITEWSMRDPTLTAETVVKADAPEYSLTPRTLLLWVLLVGTLISSLVLIALQFYAARRSPGHAASS